LTPSRLLGFTLVILFVAIAVEIAYIETIIPLGW
jgi:hypothetical protein